MNAEYLIAGTLMCTKAGLTGISGGATTYSTGATALMYSVLGKAATKAQVSGGASPTTDAYTGATFAANPLPINFGTVFLWGFDASGNIKVAQGKVQPLDSAGNFVLVPPELPYIGDLYCPFAYHVVKNGSTGANFVFGTTNWNATGLTHAVVDILTLTARPQIS